MNRFLRNSLKTNTQKWRVLAIFLLLVMALPAFTQKAQAACKAKFGFTVSGLTATFTDSSTSGGTYTSSWSFGDGTSSSTKNPSHKYANKDSTYKVCLIINDSVNKCKTYYCANVTIKNIGCAVSFTYSVSGLVATFKNTSASTGKFSSSWSFGDGSYSTTASPSHTYSKDSTYYVCLKITDSAAKCSATYCTKVTVKSGKGCSPSFTYTASGRTITFTNTSSANHAFYQIWDFGDKNKTSTKNPVHTYTGTDTVFTVCLTVVDTTAGCSTTVCKTVKVPGITTCTAAFSYSASGRTISFTNTSTSPKSYTSSWSFGDGNYSTTTSPVHTYSKDTTYYVCLKITDSLGKCNNTYCAYITVKAAACTSSFSYKVSGRAVTFTNTSSTKYSYTSTWDFGDKTTSTTKSPSHTYSGTDTIYKVCLIIYDSAAKCSTYYCTSVKVAPAACAASYTYTVSGKTVTFTNTSSAKNAYSSAWFFGDGSSGSTKSPSHTYSKDSTYNCCLKIVDSVTGCYSYYCVNITIKTTTSGCTASFKDSVSGRTVYFKNTSSAKNSYVSSWDFGDKGTSTSKDPSHTYAGNDSAFKICLTIKDTVAKCTTSYCATIAVKVYCKPSFAFADSGKTVYFKNTTTAIKGNKVSYIWFLGDGSSSTATNPSHTYSKDSTYYACLKMTDSTSGCVAYNCQYVKVSSGTTYIIGGRVYADSNLAYPGIVYLITFNPKDSSLKAINYTKLSKDTVGAYYYFKGLSAGTYYTKAALDTACKVYKKYLPTYHTKSTKWAKSDKIVLSTKDITNAEIHMEKGTNKGGKGFIGGKITAGANKVGDPMPDVEVMLYDASANAIAYTYSDATGAYQFDNLDYGTYEVYAEVLGLVTYPSWVSLSETNQKNTNTDITVNSTQVRGVSGVVIQKASADNISVYPNPVRNDLMLNIHSRTIQEAHVGIYDINGKLVSQSKTAIAQGDQMIQINTANLNNGTYFLKVQLGQEQVIMQSTFVKVSK